MPRKKLEKNRKKVLTKRKWYDILKFLPMQEINSGERQVVPCKLNNAEDKQTPRAHGFWVGPGFVCKTN